MLIWPKTDYCKLATKYQIKLVDAVLTNKTPFTVNNYLRVKSNNIEVVKYKLSVLGCVWIQKKLTYLWKYLIYDLNMFILLFKCSKWQSKQPKT